MSWICNTGHKTNFYLFFFNSPEVHNRPAWCTLYREEELLTEAAQLEAETKRAAAVSACWEDDRQAVAGSGHFLSGSFF